MGIAVALEARSRGHDVTLLLGRGAMEPPETLTGCCERFETTADLQQLLGLRFPSADLLIMAAAVSDFIPQAVDLSTKRSRTDGPLHLSLEPAPDLVAAVASSKRADQCVVGFALESSSDLTERASAKLLRKGLDAIVANPLETMDADCISGTLITADGVAREAPPGLSKPDFAAWLLDRIAAQT